MKQFMSLILMVFFMIPVLAQDDGGIIVEKDYKNKEVKQKESGKTVVGGYGEMVLTDEAGSTPANMEFYRFVFYMDHYFNEWIAFKSELEYEHGVELTLEQAFLELALKENMALRAGLILMPTSRINLYHEPAYFYPVYRPYLDKYITPTTWREFGVGFVGSFENGISYEAYIMAGLNSEKFSGKNSIRSGRQGAGALENGEEAGGFKANLSEPAFTARIDYATPVSGLNVGAAVYYGGTDNREDGLEADGKVTIFSLDASYKVQYLDLRAAIAMNSISNAKEINDLNGLSGTAGVGEKAQGFNVTAAYDLMPYISEDSEQQLLPFVFVEKYNLHASVPENTVKNDAFNVTRYILGVNYKPDYNVVFKFDYTFEKTEVDGADTHKYFQLGIGYNF
ncbi:MAG: hypothetical protein Kow00108_10390 [Calditrichia bacterium]